ncbi:DinB family protein [Fulvivirga sp.]|uniref:DinB family protein n=1 Tax=Fulvivirga sp. TaxID=1931237 RepID=UPI0032F0295C
MTNSEIHFNEYDPYYGRYISKIAPSTHLRDGYINGLKQTMSFFKSVPKNKLLYNYAPDKWTVQEILQHLIDTEKIFMYRCFRIARRDTTSLAGFNQEIYVEPSGANNKSIEELLDEYRIGREGSITFLKSITDEDLLFIGDANGGPMSARAAAFTIIGHDIWHMEIIKGRYL